MGVAGCGKSTVGALLAQLLDVPFIDADSLHPQSSIDRMAAGLPLTDTHRAPWLRAVGEALAAVPSGAVVACSALRRAHRDLLRETVPDATFVHLDGTRGRLAERLEARPDHFMPATLLASQLRTLEPLAADEEGAVLSIESAPTQLAAAAVEVVTCRRSRRHGSS